MDWNTPEIQPSDLNGSRMRRIELGCTSDYRDRNPTIEAQDCLPIFCHNLCPACKQDCSFFRLCSIIRTKSMILLKSKYFFSFIVVVILLSNCQLVRALFLFLILQNKIVIVIAWDCSGWICSNIVSNFNLRFKFSNNYNGSNFYIQD